MNSQLKKFLSITGWIVFALFGVLSWALIIINLFFNTSETLIGLLVLILTLLIYIIPKKLKSRQQVIWSSYPELGKVFWGLGLTSGIYTVFVFINIFDNIFELEFSGTPIIYEYILYAVFSWVAFLAVANASKFATLLTRGFLITYIIFEGLLFNKFQTKFDPFDFGEWMLILFISSVIAMCIKGLIISFSKTWIEQFKNQKSPFIIILAIIFFNLSVISIQSSKRPIKSTPSYPPLEQTK